MQQNEKKEQRPQTGVWRQETAGKPSGAGKKQAAPKNQPAQQQKPPVESKKPPAQKQQNNNQQPAKRGRPRKQQLEPVKISFLGGLNEVGKNLTVYEFRGERIIVDCGLAFPDAETPGIDLIIPDYA